MSAAECINRIQEIQVRMDTVSPTSLASAAKTPAPSETAAASFTDALTKALAPAVTEPASPASDAKPTEIVDAINKLTQAIAGGQSAALNSPGGLGSTSQSSIASLLSGTAGVSQQSQMASLFGVTL